MMKYLLFFSVMFTGLNAFAQKSNPPAWIQMMDSENVNYFEAVEAFNKRKVKILAADPVPPIPPVPSQSFQYIYHPEEFKIE